MKVLSKKFSMKEWHSGKPQSEREAIINEIGIENSRVSLFMSTDLNNEGKTYYVFTENLNTANNIVAKFKMDIIEEEIDSKELRIEFGNSDLLNS